MGDLNTEQTIIVEERGLQGQDRPTFFNATTRQAETIGDDLEAFSILIEPDLREEIIDRLGESNQGDPDRRELYEEALLLEEEDANTGLTFLENRIAGFGAFRTRVLNSPCGSTPDVAPLIQDVQRGVGIVTEQRERAYHRLQASRVLSQLNERFEGSQDEIQQRDSWEGVLSRYRE